MLAHPLSEPRHPEVAVREVLDQEREEVESQTPQVAAVHREEAQSGSASVPDGDRRTDELDAVRTLEFAGTAALGSQGDEQISRARVEHVHAMRLTV